MVLSLYHLFLYMFAHCFYSRLGYIPWMNKPNFKLDCMDLEHDLEKMPTWNSCIGAHTAIANIVSVLKDRKDVKCSSADTLNPIQTARFLST
ncbi:hypothetical protein BJ165DRAFT_504342 [Panaeolus papilionaceus]|nr:hypothetical protein BJ165DRAFT_504342 [Panaeolus papilionaceus]